MTKAQKISHFKNEVKRFIDFFCLYNWRVDISIEADIDSKAVCRTWPIDRDGNGRIADIVAREEWIDDKETDKNEISSTAFHEVFELLLNDLRAFGSNNDLYFSQREIDNEIHRIIRVMENKVLPLIK